MPDTFRYTDEHPYIGKGLNRYSKKGKAYTYAEADLTKFNDLYLNKCYYGSKDNMPIVYYEYAKILGNLYIHYVDEINNSLLPDDTKTGQINVGEYTTNSKEIDKYRNVSVNTTDKEATIDEESYTVSGNYKEKDIPCLITNYHKLNDTVFLEIIPY